MKLYPLLIRTKGFSAARCGLFPAKWLKLSKGWRVNLVAYKPPESGFYQVGEWLEVAYVASLG